MVNSRRGLSPNKRDKFWRRVFGTFQKGDEVIFTSPATGIKYICRIKYIYLRMKDGERRAKVVCIQGKPKGIKGDILLEFTRHFHGS